MIKETRHSQCLCSKHAYLDAIANADDDNYVHSTCYGMPESITGGTHARRPDFFSCIHLLPVWCVASAGGIIAVRATVALNIFKKIQTEKLYITM